MFVCFPSDVQKTSGRPGEEVDYRMCSSRDEEDDRVYITPNGNDETKILESKFARRLGGRSVFWDGFCVPRFAGFLRCLKLDDSFVANVWGGGG